MQPIRVEKYFAALFGFDERGYDATKSALLSMCRFETERGRERCLFSHPAAPGRELSSGWHYTPSVAQLRREVGRAVEDFEARHPGYLARVRATHHPDCHAAATATATPFTAVGALRLAHVIGVSSEQHLRFPGAVFQAASQFNLLEFISPTVTPEAGVGGYVFDKTQGPDCAVACFAGTAYRNYLLHPDFVHDGELPSYRSEVLLEGDSFAKPRPPLSVEGLELKRGQRQDWQVDTLQDITRFITGFHGGREGHHDVPSIAYDQFYRIRNGYFCGGMERIAGLTDRLSQLANFFDTNVTALLDDLSGMLRIGVVEDGPVTCGILHGTDADAGTGATAGPPSQSPPHTVWQTYNSALSLHQRRRSGEEESAITTLARCVLNGSYEATLLVGAHRTLQFLDHVGTQSGDATVLDELPPIFLTKVGGGVFHNQPAWILSAIERAMGRVSGLGVPLELRLVHFRNLDPQYLPSPS